MNVIDFSSKHNILLEDEEGLRVPMDEPYYRVLQIAPGTWRILSDGDYSYLLAGEDEAILIDSGYGAGNIRTFCEELIHMPVRRICNTHDHFDHTANNAYFDLAYMSAETKPLATVPFPSFAGVTFPRDYPIQVVGDGEVIPTRGRDLTVIKIPDHAVGSICLLDSARRILFSGDELGMPFGKPLNGSVARWVRHMEKLLQYRGQYDAIYGGGGAVDADIAEKYLENARYILAGHEGVPQGMHKFNNFEESDAQGRVVWKRRLPHPGDGPKNWHEDDGKKRMMEHAGCKIIYHLDRLED